MKKLVLLMLFVALPAFAKAPKCFVVTRTSDPGVLFADFKCPVGTYKLTQGTCDMISEEGIRFNAAYSQQFPNCKTVRCSSGMEYYPDQSAFCEDGSDDTSCYSSVTIDLTCCK